MAGYDRPDPAEMAAALYEQLAEEAQVDADAQAAQDETNLDVLAYDIADLFDRNDYAIDASAEHIRAALPAFLAEVRRNAEAG